MIQNIKILIRFFGLFFAMNLLFTGCASLGHRSQVHSLDLLPMQDTSSLIFADVSKSLALLPTLEVLLPQLTGLSTQVAEDQKLLSRLSQVYVVQTPGKVFLLIHGNFPGFAVEWILGTRFGFRLDQTLLADQNLIRQFPRLRPMVPGPRTQQKLGLQSSGLSELIFHRALILDQGTLLFELDGRLLPWTGLDPVMVDLNDLVLNDPPIFWFSIPLSQNQSLFGLSRVAARAWQSPEHLESPHSVNLTQNNQHLTEPNIGTAQPAWRIDSRFYHGRSIINQVSRDQRVFQSLLRLSLVAMANQGILSQTPSELRTQVSFTSSEQGLELAYSKVEGIRLSPDGLLEAFRLILTLLEGP
jgi:hypothetical protein